MIFTPTPLEGAFVIELEERRDDRGFFARTFCQNEFKEHGLDARIAQANVSFNHKRGTLRGMHYQVPPHQEDKVVRVLNGAIFDAIADIRPDSPTYLQWFGVELSAENRKMLYVPKGFAHGYQALTDGAEVLYLVTQFYAPNSEQGIRYDDPAFKIEWPIADPILSPKDTAHSAFRPEGSRTP